MIGLLRGAILLAASLVGAAVGSDRPAELWGWLNAHADLARGRPGVVTFGFGTPPYAALLEERYQIEDRWMGCTLDRFSLAYAKSYNAVSADAARLKFGRDVFSEALRETSTRDFLNRERQEANKSSSR